MFKKLRNIAKNQICRGCSLLDSTAVLRDISPENRK